MVAYAFYESDTRILQYATALAQRGDLVDVIALRRDESFPESEVLNGVNVFRIQSRTVNEKGLFAYGSRILRFLFRSIWFLHKRKLPNSVRRRACAQCSGLFGLLRSFTQAERNAGHS